MSRAFTKEDDAGEDLPELPIPMGPNYVTLRGFELLKNAVVELTAKKRSAVSGEDLRPVQRDLRYLEARIAGAIVVPRGTGPEVRFGANVEIEHDNGARQTFQIVGDDEARTSDQLLAWSSPLALAMMGGKPGETASWETEGHTAKFKIIRVEY